MKQVLIFLFSLPLLPLACGQGKATPEQLVYTESSRGFRLEMTLQEEQVKLVREGLGAKAVSIDMPAGTWEELLGLLRELDQEAFLASGDQEAMASDRAPGASIRVHYPDRVVHSSTWSSGAPPQSLEPLENRIRQLLKLVESQG